MEISEWFLSTLRPRPWIWVKYPPQIHIHSWLVVELTKTPLKNDGGSLEMLGL